MFLRNEASAKKIEEKCIDKLRGDQNKAIKGTKWKIVDSQPAFDGRSICAVSPERSVNGMCPETERFAWTKGGEMRNDHPFMAPITSFARWEPYASDRTRGIHTGNDAFVTMARFNSNGELFDDWFRGTVHPDAKAHASIADLIGLPKVAVPEKK